MCGRQDPGTVELQGGDLESVLGFPSTSRACSPHPHHCLLIHRIRLGTKPTRTHPRDARDYREIEEKLEFQSSLKNERCDIYIRVESMFVAFSEVRMR